MLAIVRLDHCVEAQRHLLRELRALNDQTDFGIDPFRTLIEVMEPMNTFRRSKTYNLACSA